MKKEDVGLLVAEKNNRDGLSMPVHYATHFLTSITPSLMSLFVHSSAVSVQVQCSTKL